MKKIATAALCMVATTAPAMASITWDGARFIRNGLAEWYDDIANGGSVSNIYFQSGGTMLYTGNGSSGEHWLNEDLSTPGTYDYTFLASNNLGNTGITVYNLELNFNGAPRITAQASTTSDYTGGASYTHDGLTVELASYGFNILPIGAGGVDLVSNFDSVPDGAPDIVGHVQFKVVPTPSSLASLSLSVALLGMRRRRRTQ